MIPQNTSATWNYASFGRRSVAVIIDTTLLMIALSPVQILSVVFNDFSDTDSNPAGLFSLPTLSLQFLAWWLYFAVFESSHWQATIGKRLCGLIVVTEDGSRLSFARATGRFLGKYISGLILSVGYLMAAFTARKQALHDIMAGTLVLRRDAPAIAPPQPKTIP
jgi:uncharacterized RDD family membrane protein YckC